MRFTLSGLNPFMRWVISLAALVAVVSLGCSTRGGTRPTTDSAFPDSGVSDAAMDSTTPPPDTRPRADTGPDLSTVLVYAHSRDTLFTFSPADMRVEEVALFRDVSGGDTPNMLDLAVDAEGNVFTASSDELWTVDPETAAVTMVGSFGLGDQLFALSFLAPGELGPNEVLIGATNEGAYYRIDITTARAVLLGTYPDGWRSSGDIVSVADLGTFATVRRDDFPSDVLVQILFSSDGTSTVLVKGPIKSDSRDFTEIFGIGYWGRVLYGFSNAGELIEINRDTGAGSLVATETGTDQFWGAGVTTVVPVLF